MATWTEFTVDAAVVCRRPGTGAAHAPADRTVWREPARRAPAPVLPIQEVS